MQNTQTLHNARKKARAQMITLLRCEISLLCELGRTVTKIITWSVPNGKFTLTHVNGIESNPTDTAYCEFFCWNICVYELTQVHNNHYP